MAVTKTEHLIWAINTARANANNKKIPIWERRRWFDRFLALTGLVDMQPLRMADEDAAREREDRKATPLEKHVKKIMNGGENASTRSGSATPSLGDPAASGTAVANSGSAVGDGSR